MSTEIYNDSVSTQDNSNDDDSSDDPRIDAMFQQSNPPTQSSPRKLQVSDTAIVDCFQRALDSFVQPHPAGLWTAPALFASTTTNNIDTKDADNNNLINWQPADLTLPMWMVQPPEKDALANTEKE